MALMRTAARDGAEPAYPHGEEYLARRREFLKLLGLTAAGTVFLNAFPRANAEGKPAPPKRGGEPPRPNQGDKPARVLSPEELRKSVAELAPKLSAEEFDVREDATLALIALGPAALPLLAEVKPADQEATIRLARVRAALAPQPEPAHPRARLEGDVAVPVIPAPGGIPAVRIKGEVRAPQR